MPPCTSIVLRDLSVTHKMVRSVSEQLAGGLFSEIQRSRRTFGGHGRSVDDRIFRREHLKFKHEAQFCSPLVAQNGSARSPHSHQRSLASLVANGTGSKYSADRPAVHVSPARGRPSVAPVSNVYVASLSVAEFTSAS